MAWWASPIACGSAVHHLRREGAFTATEAAQVLATFAGVLDAANVVEAGDKLGARALRLLGVHPLQAADAQQLAAALLWARENPGGRDFVNLDERLRTAAILEGFSVLPTHDRPPDPLADDLGTRPHGARPVDPASCRAPDRLRAAAHWRSDMGVEPTQDRITAPQTVLKTAVVTGPRAAPCAPSSHAAPLRSRAGRASP